MIRENIKTSLIFIFALLAILLTPGNSYAQGLPVINEFMTSNATVIADEDGDFEDWIELYNPGPESINLEGWGLSDRFNDPFMWVFPQVILAPGEWLLVWASGKDRREEHLHTSFRLSASGETILLSDPLGNWVDMVLAPAIPTDISMGRKSLTLEGWFYFDQPTPGADNDTQYYYGILEPLVFSKPAGFYSETFILEIEHTEPGVTILYTTDGSDPHPDHLGGTSYVYKNQYAFQPGMPMGEMLTDTFRTHLYSGSLLIEDRSNQPDKLTQITSTVQPPYYIPAELQPKGTVVRAVAQKEGYLTSPVVTQSYFAGEETSPWFSLPVVSISMREDWLFDYYQGIYTPGEDADAWRLENPAFTYTWPFAGNYNRRGDEWEYPAGFEYFVPGESGSKVNQQVGVRIHGGATRSFPMKSLRIYARNRYGASSLDYLFFGPGNDSSFRRLILRNSGNDFITNIWEPGRTSRTMFRDAAIQTIVRHLDTDTQDHSPVMVFINGEFWGLHNIRERYDRHYLERAYGVDPENIDLLSSHGYATEGDAVHYSETFTFLENNSLEAPANYNHILTRIDEENFIDYQIANIFACNTDWPGNNLNLWRLRTEEYLPDTPKGHDGRWRFMLFDTDFGFGLWGGDMAWQHNTLAFATEAGNQGWPNPDWSTLKLRRFLENESFRHKFINRFADLLNTAFLPERTLFVIDSLQQAIAPEMPNHLQRWNNTDDTQEWEKSVEVMREFARKRPTRQREQIKDFFSLKGLINVSLDVSHPWHGHIRINTIDIHPATPGVKEDLYPWKGLYYREIPLKVTAIAAPGYRFSHWEGDAHGTEESINYTPGNQHISLVAHFVPTHEEILLHYYFFDDHLPNDTPLQNVKPFYTILGNSILSFESCLPEYPYDPGHPWWRKASLERRNFPTHLNYRPQGNDHQPFDPESMRALQVRQPFVYEDRENAVVLFMPTTGARDPRLRFAAINEGAANEILVDYSVSQELSWTQMGLSVHRLFLTSWYQGFEIDFSGIEEADNNPWFAIRLRFAGSNIHQWGDGRVTLNNISLDGVICNGLRMTARSSGMGEVTPGGNVDLYECSTQTFTFTPRANHRISKVTLDDEDITQQVTFYDDHSGEITVSGITSNHLLHVRFVYDPLLLYENETSIIVYPNPAGQWINIASDEEMQKLEIFDLSGRRIYERKVAERQAEINTAGFPQGVYIIRIVKEGEVYREKISILPPGR